MFTPHDLIPELNQAPPLSLEDSQIPWLSVLCDKNRMLQLLSKHFGVHTLEITPLAHVASMRATFLYRMSDVEWIAKTSTSKQPERVYANYWALWQASEGTIPIPKPTGFLLNPPVTFQEKVSGTRLGALVDDVRFPKWIVLVAEAIAKFHQLDVPIRGTRDLVQEEKNFHRWKNLLIQIRPDLKGRLTMLGDKILEGFSQTFLMSCPIHADFHHTNILADEKGVTLIDMDEVAYGDPCVDVGRLLSSLRLPSLRVFGSFDGLKTMREKFLETYLKRRKEDRKKIHLFEAAALFTSAASTFRLKRKNWSYEVDLFIDEIERTLKKAEPLAHKRPTLPKESHPDWAIKEEYVRILLSPHIFQRFGQEISSCHIIKEESRHNYRILRYLVRMSEKEKPLLLELFIHRTKEEAFLLTLITLMNKWLKNEHAPIRFQEPLAYLPEIRAAVFYGIEGRSLKEELFYSDPEEMGRKFAQGVRLIEKSNGPIYLKYLSITDIFVCNDFFYIRFTAPKTRIATLFNVVHFSRQMQKTESLTRFLESFKRLYQQL